MKSRKMLHLSDTVVADFALLASVLAVLFAIVFPEVSRGHGPPLMSSSFELRQAPEHPLGLRLLALRRGLRSPERPRRRAIAQTRDRNISESDDTLMSIAASGQNERGREAVPQADFDCFWGSKVAGSETADAVDDAFGWHDSSDLSDVRSSEALRQPPSDGKATVRDAQKLLRRIQRGDGVLDLDLDPPTGFDELPDVMVIGGDAGANGEDLAVVQSWNFGARRWREEHPMGVTRLAPAAVRWGHKVFVFGGISQGCPQATFESFDLRTGRWTLEGLMPQERAYCAAALCGNRIYVIGGVDGRGECRNSVWSYDPKVHEWSNEPPLLRPRGQAAVASLGGRLYVVGGIDWSVAHVQEAHGPVCLDSVESYDPTARSWYTEAPLRRPRASAALVAYESRLYVMGGTDDEWLPMSDCEILDDLHSSSRWRPGPQLVYARSNPTAVVSKHGEILVFGGASALPRPLASYELLETQPSSSDLSQGRLLGVMPHAAAGAAAVILTDRSLLGAGSPENLLLRTLSEDKICENCNE